MANKQRFNYLIDWLQGTVPSEHTSIVRRHISEAFGGGDFIEHGHGIQWYAKQFRHASGAVIGTENRTGNTRDFIQFSASTWGLLTQQKQHELMSKLKDFGFKSSMIHLTVDDYSKEITAERAKQAYDNDCMIGFREGIKKSAGRYYSSGKNSSSGSTMAFGSKGSNGGGKQINFYDKWLESKGEIDASRIELCLSNVSRGDYANQAFTALVNLGVDYWAEIIRGYVTASIDFCNKCDRGYALDRLEWWQELCDDTTKLEFVTKSKQQTSVGRSLEWFKRQIEPTLAMVFNAICKKWGVDTFWEWFYTTIFNGEGRMSPEQVQAIAYFSNNAIEGGLCLDEYEFPGEWQARFELNEAERRTSKMQGGRHWNPATQSYQSYS